MSEFDMMNAQSKTNSQVFIHIGHFGTHAVFDYRSPYLTKNRFTFPWMNLNIINFINTIYAFTHSPNLIILINFFCCI